jgi:hypothetical protein
MPAENTVQQELTVSRAFRIKKSELDILEKEAREQNQSVNQVVNDLIDRHIHWGIHTKNARPIFMPSTLLKAILEEIPDDRIVKIAEEFATHDSGLYLTGFPKSAEEALERYRALCKYGQSNGYEEEDVGDTKLVSIDHEVGKKFSLFEAAHWKSVFALAHAQISTRFTDNLVIFEIRSTDLRPKS